MVVRTPGTRSILGVGLACALAWSPACSETEAREPEAPRIERLALAEVREDTRSDRPKSTAKLLPTDDVRFECLRAEELEHDGPPTWSVLAEQPSALQWRVGLPAARCQRVVLTCSTVGYADARLLLYGATERVAESVVALPLHGEPGAAEVETVVFELPSTYHDAREVVLVELFLHPLRPTHVTVHSLELLAVPIRAALASVAQEPGFVRVGSDQRRAFGLSSWVPLVARCEPRPDSVLSFACALPDALARQAGPLELEVELADGRGVLASRRTPLESGGDRRWIDVELPLAAWAGRPVELRWRLDAPGRDVEAVCALSPPILGRRTPRPASVLLVTSDTHRADHVSAAGLRHDVSTPEIDRLTARGTWFSNCVSPSNATTPSHAAILTGTSPRDTRVVDNVTLLASDAITLAERFRDAGFLTWAVVSANHLDDPHSGFGQGFERFSAPSEPQRRAQDTLAIAERWLDAQPGLPLFLWVHLFDAHTPYAPDDEFLAGHWPDAADPFDPGLPVPDLCDDARQAMPEGLRDLEYMRACYRAEVSELDAHLPRLFEHPRLVDGVIALTADHGESLGAHGVFWDHRGLYPQSTHVPLVLCWPDGPRGVRSDLPVSNLDLARTLLDLAGLAGVEFPGRSLVAQREDAPEPRFMLAAGGVCAAVQHRGWLGILSLREDMVWIAGNCHEPAPVHAFELYDLGLDPRCTDDRAAAEPGLARRMRAALVDWLASARADGLAGPAVRDEHVLEGLRALGYATEATDVSGAWIEPDCACARCAAYR